MIIKQSNQNHKINECTTNLCHPQGKTQKKKKGSHHQLTERREKCFIETAKINDALPIKLMLIRN